MVRASQLVLLWLPSLVEGFYIPGWSIKSYRSGDSVPLLVNKVYSDNTQLQYAYYDLPFVCPPTGHAGAKAGLFSGQSVPLNLGEVLRGDRIKASDMEIVMGRDTACTFLCTRRLPRADLERTRDMVRDGYLTEWIVDNLPGATSFVTTDKTKKYYAAGFKLGYTEAASVTGELRYFLHNHHTIVVRHGKAPGRAGERGERVVVGFEVYPKSVGSENKRDASGCPVDLKNVKGGLELRIPDKKMAGRSPDEDANKEEDDSLAIPYTYSVYFREDESVEWARRWDLYFVNQEEGSRIHWLALVNSLIICGLLSGIVMLILVRKTARREVVEEDGKIRMREMRPRRRSRRAAEDGGVSDDDDGDDVGDDGADVDSDDDDEAMEDATGWKLLHADVFRKPPMVKLLAPLVGSGMQLLFVAAGLVLLSAVGVLNPSFRGGFISVGVGLFISGGLVSGYLSARVYRSLEGVDDAGNGLTTALLFPGLALCFAVVLNTFAWAQASSTAMPIGTLLAMVVLWLCVQVPLVLMGSRLGRGGRWEHPSRTAPIARQVPPQAWYARPIQSTLLAGLMPFIVIFIELLFVFQSVWQDKSGYYYVFGFLAAASTIQMVTVAEVTVVTVYMQLCAEDHRWWWRSFYSGAGSAVWVFCYCAWCYVFKLHVAGFVSGLLFFAYSFMACVAYGLLAGAVGFLSAYAFVRRMYGSIKLD
ncbi:Nonaspanin (TM9SF) [Ophiocordyceps camponoti-floridani]|uniref:Transmembrane 9 superfamily member n=1 Tax=Ophiocordyceps camponoti-floridani TaxID=2030778 RepID=A0A8H4VDE4_9HYPO|nr:Nonaspanin (TM9SF) [Ophiocordyceps camponoti-floridani]